MTVYCCFLPDLTEFTGPCCAGPERQHHSLKADHKIASPRVGIQPRYSGLQVQGTATSPLSTTTLIITTIPEKDKGRSLLFFSTTDELVKNVISGYLN